MTSRIAAVLITLLLTASVAQAVSEEALLDSLQHTAFDFFWNEANPSNGLIKDRSTPGSPCSIASVGFGLTAICIGIDHGWVSREDGRERILTTLQTFWNGPQGSGADGFMGYQGLFYHFLDMQTGTRVWDSELSTIDTALLIAGILDARQYFWTVDPLDIEVRDLADAIYERANWDFMRNFNQGILMGWRPGSGFSGFGQWIGYNEAMILYILALGSPTHPVPESAWSAWTSGYSWQTHYGYSYVNFPPLFGHQYSHCWIDFRHIQDDYMRDRGITYFENSRRATLAQREYCIDNPGGFLGYGENVWGITASDGPEGYNARGAPPPFNDNGTITPTAVGGSVPFAPEVTIPTLQHMFDTYGSNLWSTYGFLDAFNLSQAWWATDYIGIDQGPIIIMIENYRNGSVWSRIIRNTDIQLGLDRAGFTIAAGIDDEITLNHSGFRLLPNAPNPFVESTEIRFLLDAPGHVRVTVDDVSGRRVANLLDEFRNAGPHAITLRDGGLASGVYYYNLWYNGQADRKRCVLVR